MINRHQDAQSKRDEEFQFQVQQARSNPDLLKSASPEVKEAADNQSKFSERRKKYGL